MSYFNRLMSLTFFLGVINFSACGEKKPAPAPAPVYGKTDMAFLEAERDQNIPKRFLMAVGYMESRLSAQPATALYGDRSVSTGLISSAFGIGIDELEFAEGDDPLLLVDQVKAYATWLNENMVGESQLARTPRTLDEKFAWIQGIARAHRTTGTGSQELVSIFMYELIDVLNRGFLWKSPDGKETLELKPESPAIEIGKLQANNQKSLELTQVTGEVRGYSQTISLPYVNRYKGQNNPKRVEIIHCPLSLSGCLALQKNNPDRDQLVLGAHYVIPNENIGPLGYTALQIADHDEVVFLTDDNGEPQPVKDSIVIMLAGMSGRIIESNYQWINPEWYSDEQLKNMGQLTFELCKRFYAIEQTQLDACMDYTNPDIGVKFHFAKPDGGFRWGDIADFGLNVGDHLIFHTYIVERKLRGEAVMSLPANSQVYQNGQDVQVKVDFQSGVQAVELQQLLRCQDGKRLVWDRIAFDQISNETSITFSKKFIGRGPEGNGSQYLRVLAYQDGTQEILLGWDMGRVYIENFDDLEQYAPKKQCL